jgi:FkbM family methyltransferase
MSRIQRRLARRRKICEALGLDRYSRPALNELDRKLERYLPARGGFFVEAGAFDGFTQSNTYYFERFRGWRGVLVEPLREPFERCRRERPRSQVFQCALVPADYGAPTVTIHDAGLMSLLDGAQKSPEADAAHCRRGAEVQEIVVGAAEVPARTLSSVLDEAGATRIDLLSLDVEGYELQVLRGLDLARHRPVHILVEARFREEIVDHLRPLYEPIAELSHHDVLFRLAHLATVP